jgi:predicted dehydrogenase
MPDFKPLGLAMIGLQHQHPRWYQPLWAHLPQYRPLAICDPDEQFVQSESAFFGLDPCTDYRSMLERDDIDVVIIWLPHSEMPRAVEDAAAAGKHVIVEKPCCADLAGARHILESSQRYPDVKISSPFCWRTHPATRHIRDTLAQGLLGEPMAIEARLNAGGAWRYVRDHAEWMLLAKEGGGPMWNLGVHWIDYITWITGQRVVSVYGQVSGPAGDPTRDIEDNAQALLKLNQGTIAMLDISYGLADAHPGNRDIYFSIRGSKGTLQWTPSWEGLTDEILIVTTTDQTTDKPVRRLTVQRRDIPGYCGEMALNWLEDFADTVNVNRPLSIGSESIYSAIQTADAFYRSVVSGNPETPTHR